MSAKGDTETLIDVRGNDGALRLEFVTAVRDALAMRDSETLRELLGAVHEADLADLLELLKSDQRQLLIELEGSDFDFTVLPEVQEPVRDEIVEAMPNEQVAEVVRELETDDAVSLLENLDEQDRLEILAKIPLGEQASVRRGLDYPEDSAGRLMQTALIAVPPFWTVGQTIDYMRDTEDLPENFSQVFVVDPAFRVLGRLRLDKLLRTRRPVLVEDIMDTIAHEIHVLDDQEEVARQFERYDLMSAPVVDDSKRLVGVITVDDVVDVIQQEAEEDIHRLGGVGDETVSDTVWKIMTRRFTWLIINLATAILASLVIGLFDATIQQMVALAVLMPIVASMGGNAATQTMTVSVRALATKDLSTVNARRIIVREALVGLLNGLAFAAIMAIVTLLWFGNGQLGLIIAAAMIINMLVAGLAGILVPLTLDYFDIDPAISSSVFVTTVTDVVGFFAFLGLAAWWLF